MWYSSGDETVSATIRVTIEVKDKRAEYTDHITRTFPSDQAEGTAQDYFQRLKENLWDGVSDEVLRLPERYGPGYPKSESNPGGY
jgi:hypothetical protein